jgi:hypothetical protein
MRRLRAGLTYANVMSTIAVFMVLGGSAYAATALKRNSVGATQIRTGAVGSPEVKDGSLLSKDFKPGQLTPGAIGATGATGEAGAKGDKGDQGLNGDTGTAGATNVVVRFGDTVTSNGQSGSHLTNCNPGERATGGGAALAGGSAINLFYTEPGRPNPSTVGAHPTGWAASWFNNSGSTDTIRVFAVCASP